VDFAEYVHGFADVEVEISTVTVTEFWLLDVLAVACGISYPTGTSSVCDRRA